MPAIVKAALCAALLTIGFIHGAAAQPVGSLYACNRAAIYDASTNGATQLVPAGTSLIQVCGYTIWAGGTATVKLEYGTGTNCATGETAITPAFSLVAQTGVSDSSPYFRGLDVPPSNALCIKTSAGVAVQAIVYYSQFP